MPRRHPGRAGQAPRARSARPAAHLGLRRTVSRRSTAAADASAHAHQLHVRGLERGEAIGPFDAHQPQGEPLARGQVGRAQRRQDVDRQHAMTDPSPQQRQVGRLGVEERGRHHHQRTARHPRRPDQRARRTERPHQGQPPPHPLGVPPPGAGAHRVAQRAEVLDPHPVAGRDVGPGQAVGGLPGEVERGRLVGVDGRDPAPGPRVGAHLVARVDHDHHVRLGERVAAADPELFEVGRVARGDLPVDPAQRVSRTHRVQVAQAPALARPAGLVLPGVPAQAARDRHVDHPTGAGRHGHHPAGNAHDLAGRRPAGPDALQVHREQLLRAGAHRAGRDLELRPRGQQHLAGDVPGAGQPQPHPGRPRRDVQHHARGPRVGPELHPGVRHRAVRVVGELRVPRGEHQRHAEQRDRRAPGEHPGQEHQHPAAELDGHGGAEPPGARALAHGRSGTVTGPGVLSST